MVLKQINLIIGANGAGKSYLLKEIREIRLNNPNSLYTYGHYLPHIVKALRLVDRNIHGVTVKETPIRINLIPYSKGKEPLVLSGGAIHLLKMFNGLLSNNSNYMFIDGIEKDLHYSILEGLWAILFTMSAHLGTKIYATTHSIDCINSFIRVKLKNDHIPACLIRLEKNNTVYTHKTFNDETLQAAFELNGDLR
jgi:AAA15 family ATPase/GTPase